jgi:MFS transporter, ACS family, tartrate transporter
LPFVFAAFAMIYGALRSDRSGSRTMYVASACALSAAGMAAGAFIGTGQPIWMMVALTVGIMGQYTIAPTFWPLPTAMLSGIAAAGGIALINAVGNLGGFVGPYMFGLLKDATGGSDLIALLALAAAPVVSMLVLLRLGHDRRLERIPSQHAMMMGD